jgi:dUTP pyrophosphatase
MLVYLAHPIDQALSRGEATQTLKRMVTSVQAALAGQGFSTFRPGRAYQVAPDPQSHRTVDRINRQALFESDAVVAVLPPGIPSLGTPAEIESALLLNRPTLIVTTQELADRSVQITNWMSRGVEVRIIDPSGYWIDGQVPNMADALASLPDPTQLMLGGTDDLLIQRTSTNAKVPSRAYRGDAGLDLAVVGEHTLQPFEYTLLPTGIKAAVPHGYWGWMTGRSSAWSKHRIRVNTAVIDSGYRGELMVGITWLPTETISSKMIMPGTRLAQYVILPSFMGDVVEVDELPGSERGEAGYGSSGH